MQLKISKVQLDSARQITDLIPPLKKACNIITYEVIGVNNGKTLVRVGKSDTLDGSTVVLLKNVVVNTKVFIDIVTQCANGKFSDSYKLTVTP